MSMFSLLRSKESEVRGEVDTPEQSRSLQSQNTSHAAAAASACCFATYASYCFGVSDFCLSKSALNRRDGQQTHLAKRVHHGNLLLEKVVDWAQNQHTCSRSNRTSRITVSVPRERRLALKRLPDRISPSALNFYSLFHAGPWPPLRTSLTTRIA